MIGDKLRAWLQIQKRRPFAWGSCDCVMFAAEWVGVVTGRDPAGPWRHSYGDASAAGRVVVQLGGWAALGHCSGWRVRADGERPVMGDVALLRQWGDPAEHRYAIAGSDGWIVKPLGGGWARVPWDRFRTVMIWECPADA